MRAIVDQGQFYRSKFPRVSNIGLEHAEFEALRECERVICAIVAVYYDGGQAPVPHARLTGEVAKFDYEETADGIQYSVTRMEPKQNLSLIPQYMWPQGWPLFKPGLVPQSKTIRSGESFTQAFSIFKSAYTEIKTPIPREDTGDFTRIGLDQLPPDVQAPFKSLFINEPTAIVNMMLGIMKFYILFLWLSESSSTPM